MAGIHFIILKVNGVDVSQMPYEEAVQMFLKSTEPILVEVRRRSYNTDSVESSEYTQSDIPNNILNQKENSKAIRQSSTMSILTSPVKNQKHSSEQLSSLDSLKFHGLVISSSENSIGLEGSNIKIETENNLNSSGSISVTTTKIYNNSASTCPSKPSNNSTHCADETFKRIVNSRTASVSSITSPTKSLHEQSATSSPLKDLTHAKQHISIGIQTDSFPTDFIFSGASMLNPEQIIDNDHNLFSECLAPEIDIEEITLRKSEINERLGLTVCYSSGGGNGSESDDTDTCTEVYISDILPDSIAGRDGRLRQGDQILQVNGKDVSNKEETETLIAENNNAVTLLVSRYLYGDDDEFNEEGEFYNEDEQNMSYANCFIEDYIGREDIEKSARCNNEPSPDSKVSTENLSPSYQARSLTDATLHSTGAMAASTSTTSSRDPLNHQNIRAHLEQVNQEIAILDSRVENMMSQHAKPLKNTESNSIQGTKEISATGVLPLMDYDTEHIYETIPEDSEPEPFYCSPYESSEHQSRIEKWLGMHDISESNNEMKTCSMQQKQQSTKQSQDNLVAWAKAKNGTLQSTNSSACDDHENSSSAYNTGGSCNSNTMTPLTLELNPNYKDREHHSSSTLILCSSKRAISPINETSTQIRQSMQNSSQESSTNRNLKEKVLSPTHFSKTTQILTNKQKNLNASQKNFEATKFTNQSTPISTSNTMYTNIANLQQTMLFQQQLFRKALIHQRVPSSSIPCPQFTAPNLSQYHFVSSQEVSTVKLNTHPNEEHMVWKVKRRQDGTRYIVRRPARNRLLRNRALRINAERNDQTTEDDTISEIKTGRYWTKEERKKHFERARERRQRQQFIITNKNTEISPVNMNSDVLHKNKILLVNSESLQQQANQSKLPQSQQSFSSPLVTSKVFRQNIPTGQISSKKMVKKINSSVDACPTVSPNSNVVVSGTGTIKTINTTSGSRMVGLLSVTTV